MIIDELKDLEGSSIRRGIPIIGSIKGGWLYKQVKELQPKKILELGTANGYSGIILGSEGAELTTVEIDPRMAGEARRNFSSFKTKAKILLGDGVTIVQELAQRNEASLDLIFIDFAKKQYLPVLEYCLTLIRKGGLIIADNITFAGCLDYKEAVLKHPQLNTEIIPIGDGLSCSERIK